MDENEAQQFFADRNNALTDGTIPVVRAFLTQYSIPSPADDVELLLSIVYARANYGITTEGDYWKDILTLQMNNRRTPT